MSLFSIDNVMDVVGELNCPPNAPSLWKHLVGMLHGPAEADVVRSTVGEAILSRNDCTRTELESLLAVLNDLRVDGQKAANSRPVLPPQPGKEMLRLQLKSVLDQMCGVEAAAASFLPTARERMIIEYVQNPKPLGGSLSGAMRPHSRGSTLSSRSRDSRPTSSDSCRSVHADPHAGLQPIQRQLRFDRVAEVKGSLEELFATELELLKSDVDYVRSLIEEEVCAQRYVEPTQKEMKEFATKVESLEAERQHREKISSLPSASSFHVRNVATKAGSFSKRGSLPSLESL